MMEDNQYIEKGLEHEKYNEFWHRLTKWIIAVFAISIAFLTIIILWRVFL